jgi:hypothetical protein
VWQARNHCGHEFCTCQEHCERKPVAAMPCHREHEAPTPQPLLSLSDACHAGEARELLALQSYLLPDPDPKPGPLDRVSIDIERPRDPRFGFSRIDLPPPRFLASLIS